MKNNIFNSKRLFIANIIFCSILLTLTIISLYAFIYMPNSGSVDEYKGLELFLYSIYFVIYILALIVIFLRHKNTIRYLNIIFSFAIILNVADFGIHYSEYNNTIVKYISVGITTVIILVFSVMLYLNNRKRPDLSLIELDEIGNKN